MLLERFGCEIDFSFEQICCGQPAFNSGHRTSAKKAMQQMMLAFENAEYIVAPSGSCIAMLKQYPSIFADDPKRLLLAENVANKSYELCQFLVDVLQIKDVGSNFRGTVTFHPSCHMTRLLGEKDAPLTLLNHVKGLQLE